MRPTSPALFLLGAPRSGTTLAYRCLAMHPDAAWINNYLRRAPGQTWLSTLDRLARNAPRTRQRAWFGESGDNAYRYGARRAWLERAFPQPVEGEPVFARRGIPEASTGTDPDARQVHLRDDVLAITRWAGGQVFISKRIGHNRRIPLLQALFPDARFAVITRDGRAVAMSLSRVDWWPDEHVWWYGGTPRDWAAKGRDPMELCARHWVEEVHAIEQGLSAVPAEQVLRVRYEELVESPTAQLGRLAQFAGLTPSQPWAAAIGHLSFPDRNQDWHERLADQASLLDSTQGETLRACGYLT